MAILEFQDAIELDPNASTIHVSIADGYRRIGKLSKAEDHLGIALELDSKEKEALEMLGHIFLSQKEALKFVNLYGNIGKHYCISNCIFITKNKNHKKIKKLSNKFSFGLISNLTKEKGLDQFLRIAQHALEKNKLWEFYLAGPITFRQKHYLNQISKLSNTTYLGPIYDVKKKSLFYRNIDFFLFLSSYFHESEPLVILEAISNGSIPIVFDRGSISDLVCSKELINLYGSIFIYIRPQVSLLDSY